MGQNTIRKWLRASIQGPRLFQSCLYWVVAIVLAILVVNYPAGLTVWRFYGAGGSLVLLLLLNVFFANPSPAASPRRRAVQEWGFLVLSALAILAAVWMSGAHDVIYLLSIVCAQAAYRRGIWPAGAAFGAASVLVWLGYEVASGTSLYVTAGEETSLVTGIAMILLFVALLEDLQAANAKLEAARETERDLAIAEERVRLARDIHDGLGHHLTVLSIQLQAAAKLVTRDPQAAAEAIETCRAEAQAALKDVRRSVGVMRQAPANRQPLGEALTSLVIAFGKHAGLQTSFDLAGTPAELSPQVWQTIYRAAQEGLTNAHKHAKGARHVAVRLTYEPRSVRLSVWDDGSWDQAPHAPPPAPAGFGLQGLRERVSQLGGELYSGAGEANGFRIEASIPIERTDDDQGVVG